MTTGYFVTGTDTGVGKTLVAAALLYRHANLGRRVAGMKPVASGSTPTERGLYNEDALLLQAYSTDEPPYALVNPYAFEPAIAPHLAAAAIGVDIELSRLTEAYRSLAAQTDVVIVEGAGGWRVPIGPDAFLSELPERLGLGVILVVGLRLGCLNHALLTAEAIVRAGKAPFVGWVGNSIDPGFGQPAETVAMLNHCLPVPCLGVIPPLTPPDVVAAASALPGVR